VIVIGTNDVIAVFCTHVDWNAVYKA